MRHLDALPHLNSKDLRKKLVAIWSHDFQKVVSKYSAAALYPKAMPMRSSISNFKQYSEKKDQSSIQEMTLFKFPQRKSV